MKPAMSTHAPLVLYHADCADGFCSAWIVKLVYPAADLVGCRYGQPPPSASGRHVIVVDFSWKREATEMVRRSARTFLLLDHHKSAAAELQGIPGAHFDMERCGARMTFDYFAPALGAQTIEKIRWIVDHVEDRDLGLMRLPRTEIICAYLDSLDHHPNDWMMAGIGGIDHATNSGRSIVRFKRRQIEQIADRAELVSFDGGEILAANATVLWSDVAKELIRRHKRSVVLTYRRRQDGQWEYSLASDGSVDVSMIATRMGGGGHASAAGFTSPTLLHG